METVIIDKIIVGLPDMIEGILAGGTVGNIIKLVLLLLTGIGLIWYRARKAKIAEQKAQQARTDQETKLPSETRSEQQASNQDATDIDQILKGKK